MDMNTSKTTSRGVQESDVWAAADALIAQGLRPTIERVRQQIGRGSPNTVSPMLETWFATLGRRLGVAGEQDPSVLQSVPDPVQRLAEELWNTALEEAKAAASKALDLREQALKAEEQAFVAQQEQLAQREATMEAQKDALNQALQAAQNHAQDLARRLDEIQQTLQERDQRLEELRDELSNAVRQRELQQQKHSEEIQSAAAERQRMAEQYGVPLLGSLPLDIGIREQGDAGVPVVVSAPDSPAGKAYAEAMRRMVEVLAQRPRAPIPLSTTLE